MTYTINNDEVRAEFLRRSKVIRDRAITNLAPSVKIKMPLEKELDDITKLLKRNKSWWYRLYLYIRYDLLKGPFKY